MLARRICMSVKDGLRDKYPKSFANSEIEQRVVSPCIPHRLASKLRSSQRLTQGNLLLALTPVPEPSHPSQLTGFWGL